MARPCRWRRICTEPEFDRFVPEGIPSPGSITLTVDEYEAVRLIDLMSNAPRRWIFRGQQ